MVSLAVDVVAARCVVLVRVANGENADPGCTVVVAKRRRNKDMEEQETDLPLKKMNGIERLINATSFIDQYYIGDKGSNLCVYDRRDTRETKE